MDSEMKPLERDIEQNQEHLCHYVLPMELHEQHRVILVNPLEVIPHTYIHVTFFTLEL